MSEIKIINLPVIENLNVTIPKEIFHHSWTFRLWKNDPSSEWLRANGIEGGEFYFDDTKINNIEPNKRNISMVSQNTLFFPHLTVRDKVMRS